MAWNRISLSMPTAPEEEGGMGIPDVHHFSHPIRTSGHLVARKCSTVQPQLVQPPRLQRCFTPWFVALKGQPLLSRPQAAP